MSGVRRGRWRAALAAAALLAAAAAEARPLHQVSVVFEPETRELRVTDRIEGAAHGLALEPADWLSVDALRIDGRPVATERDVIALRPGRIAGRPVEIELSGRLPAAPEAHGRFGAYPGGAFLFGGAGWLASAATGAAVFEIALDTPASYRALASGALLSEAEEASRYKARYRYDGPAEALSVLFGPYAVDEARVGEVRLRTYFPQRHAERSAPYLDAAARYIERYARRIGPYPYEGFSVVSAPIPVGYGLGGMTYVSERILDHPYMLGRSLAHEVLHAWWGGGVCIEAESGNWGEGLTTYQADHALAEAQGPEAARLLRREWLRRLSALPEPLDRPARSFRSAAHGKGQAVGYDKVALIFHMLKRDLGEDVFVEGLRRFWRAERGGAAGWGELRAAFEAAAGRDLGWFFGQWLDRPGLPSLDLVAASARPEGEGYAVDVALAQSEPAYRLNVPIAIETGAGVETATMHLDGREARATFTVSAPPLAVQVDPGFDVARRLPEGELPPTMREALRTADAVVALPGPGGGAARNLAARLLPEAPVVSPEASLEGEGAAVVVGARDAAAAFREAHLAGAAPEIAVEGDARAWVEQDADGRLWLFLSADSPEAFSDLLAIRYRGAASYAAFSGGEAGPSGAWLARSNPLRAALD